MKSPSTNHSLSVALCAAAMLATLGCLATTPAHADDVLTAEELKLIREAERSRVLAIQKVYHSVVAVYGDDQSGGGSGVIIDPSGLALTNHHVIMGAGVSGKGGLADGNLYDWKLIGTDPGGDVAIIQLEGKDEFPYATLADSETVKVGDWALAMGNPFILAEDQTPTVTLGIVSGIKRYQYGQGNELVYGNCIQTDSSINPGNSGGPLFNMQAQIIGINGRGSFQDRGRVNVGLGYAISSNQIRNFVPDLLATKVVEHGTLDARFGDRQAGVVCETLNTRSPIAKLGLELGDKLIAFEGLPITSANQFTNLICTLPEDWPAEVTFEKSDGSQHTIHVRMYGLPYTPPPAQQQQPDPDGEEPTPEQKRAMEKAQALRDLLASASGTITNPEINSANLERIVSRWRSRVWTSDDKETQAWRIEDSIRVGEQVVGRQEILIDRSGRFRLTVTQNETTRTYGYDGESVWLMKGDERETLRRTRVASDAYLAQLMPIATLASDDVLQFFGSTHLDGGDKAKRQIAHRLKTLDDGGNWFYTWLSVPEGYDRSDVRLLRASVDMDCNEGAVTFDDWVDSAGLNWPHQRLFVSGLGEDVQQSIITDRVETIEALDPSIFALETAAVDNESETVIDE